MLNALFLHPGASGGVDTYLRGLAPALRRVAPEMTMSVATTRRGASALRSEGWGDWCEVLEFPCDDGQRIRRQAAEQVLLPMAAVRTGVQVVHSLASLGPVWTPRLRHVVTLHDVTFFREATFGRITTTGMRLVMRGAAGDADAAITGTAVARDDIAEVLRLDPASFVVAHHGLSPAAREKTGDASALRARVGLRQQRIVLCVAAKRPHKNQELLIRALDELPEDVALVLVGHSEPYADELKALAVRNGQSDRIVFLEYVSDDELETLWSTAACAAFPTKSEGFGIPVVEAMARRVPVACSDIPVLREVGGAVPRFFAVDDPSACAAAIRETLAGSDRREAGHKWAEQYTWDASARAHLSAYSQAMARRAILGRPRALAT
jgi:glycosyltransferase involved in cell wall biosynthesis